MALNDSAVFTAARGFIFTAPVGTASPSVAEIDGFDPATGLTGWENIGHTSREDLPEFGFDGGDTEVRGSWQNESLEEVQTEVVTDYVTINLHQFDDQGLGLYYSTENASTEAGRFSVMTTTGKPLQRALCVVVMDGEDRIGFWAPKASMRREDAITMAVDEFAVLPIRATFLKQEGMPMFDWISEDAGIETGASV